MIRRKPKPDTRLHWNDDLKVYFSGHYYSAEEYRLLCERTMMYPSRAEPHYTVDKTYNLRVKRDKL